MVQQVNSELRAQHKMKKGYGDGGGGVGITVKTSAVGWGDGGKLVTNAVVGKFKYELFLISNACVRMQRLWRSKVKAIFITFHNTDI